MTETVVIAETVKGTVHPSTAELITAAQSLGSQPVVVVPCTDASAAEIASCFVGSARVVAAKSSVFEHYDAAGWAAAIDAVAPAGILVASATPQSKDLAARIAARRGISVVQDVTQIEGGNLTSPIYSGKAMQTVSKWRCSSYNSSKCVEPPQVAFRCFNCRYHWKYGDRCSRVHGSCVKPIGCAEANIIVSGGRGMVLLTTLSTSKKLQIL